MAALPPPAETGGFLHRHFYETSVMIGNAPFSSAGISGII